MRPFCNSAGRQQPSRHKPPLIPPYKTLHALERRYSELGLRAP